MTFTKEFLAIRSPLRYLLFSDLPKDTVFTVTPSKLALNTNLQLSCTADGVPSTRNYRFYVNGEMIGNNTNGQLTVNVSPLNCVNYTGEYKCVPESTIGDGVVRTKTREFDCKFLLYLDSLIVWHNSEYVSW